MAFLEKDEGNKAMKKKSPPPPPPPTPTNSDLNVDVNARPGTPKTKVYRIQRMLFHMPEITYEEDGQVLRLIDDKLEGINRSVTGMLSALHSIYQSGVVPELFGIILKPYEPTPLHRWWNRFWFWRSGNKSIDQLTRKMPNSVWTEIAVDFFTVNAGFLERLLATVSSSGSILPVVTILSNAVMQTKRSLRTPPGTTPS